MSRKTQNKYSFKRDFLKRFLACVIAVTFLLVVVVLGMGMASEFTIETVYLQNISRTQEQILESGDKQFGAITQMNVAMSSESNNLYAGGINAAVAIIDESGSIMADPKFTVFAVTRDNHEDEPSYYYCRDKDVLDFYNKYRDENVVFDFDIIYINQDGVSFRPEIVTVQKLDGEVLGLETEIVEERNFTPNITEGWIKTQCKLNIAAGATDDNSAYQLLMSVLDGRAVNDAQKALDKLCSNTDFKRCAYDTLVIDGKEYEVFSVSCFSFWETYGLYILELCLITYSIAAGVSLLFVFVYYHRYKTTHEVEEYRSNIMNALAHDLKSPLMAISGYAENIQNGTHPEKNGHYTASILENTAYMNSIIENVLQLSRLENVKEIQKEQFDVSAAVSALYEKYRIAAEGRGVKFSVSGSCNVEVSAALFSQALENLVANAVKYVDDNGSIEVVASSKRIVFTNTFTGELDADGSMLCQPLVTGDKNRSDKNGSGMGLAMVKSICEMHGFTFGVSHGSGKFTAVINL